MEGIEESVRPGYKEVVAPNSQFLEIILNLPHKK